MRAKLRELRKKKGISQSFLSKKLGYKYPSGYCNIEQGRNRLSLEQAVVIADALGVSVDDLAEDNDSFFEENLHEEGKSNSA